MSDLVAFLRSRLDEDEEAARLAHAIDPGPWYEDVDYDSNTNQRDGLPGSGLVYAADNVALWDRESSCTLSMTAPTATHVARHDPARVLAEVAAKRGIIDVHIERGECTRCEWFSGELYPCDTLKLLGSVYAGHQDYREEWKP